MGSAATAAPLFDTAHAHASTDIPIVGPQETAAVIREHLRDRPFESVASIVVCDTGLFLGLIRIEDLLTAPPEAVARDLMDTEPPVVAPGTDQELAAWLAVRHEESALAVVDGEGRFLGMIPPSRLLGILLTEHDEDMARLGGFLAQGERARATSSEPVFRRYLHRLPWLLLGLFGALAAAHIVGHFEAQLQEAVLIAFFIPGILYLSAAVGVQTEMVVVRGLSLGIPVGRVLKQELVTGVMIGLTLALLIYPLIGGMWGDWDVARGVALAVMVSSLSASTISLLLPWLLDRQGLDPAFGSGPLATVTQDLLSILIYFAIVTAVVL